jgi:ABC-type Mn2+/Zn2+ transport system ATPase subunit
MDPGARDRLAATARRLAGDGVAVLIATHDPQLVAAACDAAYALGGGVCTPAEPLGRPA